MKTVVIVTLLLFFGFCSAQNNMTASKAEVYTLKAPETYVLDSELFIFTPESNRILIKKIDNEKEQDFGKLQKTTDDGLYLMTSINTEEVFFGQFDSIGNFKTRRYDPATDTILEECFRRAKADSKK